MERLQTFFNKPIAAQRQSFEGFLSLLAPCISAGNLSGAEELLKTKNVTIRVASGPNFVERYDLTDLNLAENSVAILSLSGFLCLWETDQVIKAIKQIESNPAICGTVLVIDGPGGDATRVDVAAEAIRQSPKPVATLVTGLMHSGHYWLGVSADRVFALSKMCSVGSVGAFSEWVDLRGYYESLGAKIYEVYPDTSDLKNESTRRLVEGDDSIMKAKLEKLHKIFATHVADCLGIDYDPAHEFFRGRVFDADEALAAGYIHQIGTLEDAAMWVLTEATSRKAALLYQ